MTSFTARVKSNPLPALRNAVKRLGFEISISRSSGRFGVHISRSDGHQASIPSLFDDALKAMHYARGGKPAAFLCPIDQCVTVNGLNFSQHGWHPFSATLEEAAAQPQKKFQGSVLERFYSNWQPANAKEALIDPTVAPAAFAALPPHTIYLFPWSARSTEEVSRAVQRWTANDHLEHKGPKLATLSNSLKDQGPIAPKVAAFEWQRLMSIRDSIAKHGFRREHGDIRVLLLKRRGEYRYLNFGGGLHRTAAMKATGHTHIPARLLHNFALDVDEVDWWPQVQAGVWPRERAQRYIDHLFDFEAARWAAQRGLVQTNCASAIVRLAEL